MMSFLKNLQSMPWYVNASEVAKYRLTELLGFAMISSGVMLFFALLSYHPADPSWSSATGDAQKTLWEYMVPMYPM